MSAKRDLESNVRPIKKQPKKYLCCNSSNRSTCDNKKCSCRTEKKDYTNWNCKESFGENFRFDLLTRKSKTKSSLSKSKQSTSTKQVSTNGNKKRSWNSPAPRVKMSITDNQKKQSSWKKKSVSSFHLQLLAKVQISRCQS